MKKTKLFIEPAFDFELIGLVSPVKDYKMAWLINRDLDLDLVRSEDLKIEFLSSPQLEISQYFLSLPHGYIQLLKNKAINTSQQLAYLIPELRNLDYFLLVQDQTQQVSIATFVDHLAKNPFIQTAVRLDVSKLKSKENLLTY
ncbi:IPExxxVDY family protein [Algoriphagus sp. H41]|uniref:IPExxxVDY family protein n=1 Tax=Algoriphagus oliviformis TaxID=2811231 RepID=A0ABS3C7U6_9BACT|nr:IPExxxVDY family protein [Algoriphagus oliviformis]MBN7812636.1 IPExxxVDY family protein [Algoriphagus oliviformis]